MAWQQDLEAQNTEKAAEDEVPEELDAAGMRLGIHGTLFKETIVFSWVAVLCWFGVLNIRADYGAHCQAWSLWMWAFPVFRMAITFAGQVVIMCCSRGKTVSAFWFCEAYGLHLAAMLVLIAWGACLRFGYPLEECIVEVEQAGSWRNGVDPFKLTLALIVLLSVWALMFVCSYLGHLHSPLSWKTHSDQKQQQSHLTTLCSQPCPAGSEEPLDGLDAVWRSATEKSAASRKMLDGAGGVLEARPLAPAPRRLASASAAAPPAEEEASEEEAEAEASDAASTWTGGEAASEEPSPTADLPPSCLPPPPPAAPSEKDEEDEEVGVTHAPETVVAPSEREEGALAAHAPATVVAPAEEGKREAEEEEGASAAYAPAPVVAPAEEKGEGEKEAFPSSLPPPPISSGPPRPAKNLKKAPKTSRAAPAEGPSCAGEEDGRRAASASGNVKRTKKKKVKRDSSRALAMTATRSEVLAKEVMRLLAEDFGGEGVQEVVRMIISNSPPETPLADLVELSKVACQYRVDPTATPLVA